MKEVGFIGLGKMGSNMVLNLLDHKCRVVVYDRSFDKTKILAKKGAIPVFSFRDLIDKINSKRKIIWIMVSVGKAVDEVLNGLSPYLNKGDIIIDGGNSYYKDSQIRYRKLKQKGIYFLDVGVSGGVEGARKGGAYLIGGDKIAFKESEFIFKLLSVKNRYSYVGISGSGHFAKGIHNAIEYGMMASIAEGIEAINSKKNKFRINLSKVIDIYANGSVIQSRLIDWMNKGINRKDFDKISGFVPKGDTEDEMNLLAKEFNLDVLKEAISMRIKSRKSPSFKGKLISVMRNEFGGHLLKKK
ncbi:MAG: NADP-dependent phosphogluconate dehydrogenase [Candidatus Pacearchaeota archaeon]